MDPITCFFLKPTDLFCRSLRRFKWSDSGDVCKDHGYHNAVVRTGIAIQRPNCEYDGIVQDDWPHDDPRWPLECSCGYVFQEDDPWQHILTRMYSRADDPTVMMTTEDAPPGATFFANWRTHEVGLDGNTVMVVLPGGHRWCPDGRASNCTRPKDKVHKCWCRHGTPPDPITVDKLGNTCDAGAGSIQVPGWHGFLRDGKLVQC